MDEMGARALMERMSVTEPPPSRVDIPLARQQGAQRLRRRRWAAGVAPLLAAAAVVAVIAGTGALSRVAGSGAGSTGPVPYAALATRHPFSPLAPYATFGWLPRGDPRTLASPVSTLQQLQLTIGSAARGLFMLTVWAPATCNVDAAQVRAALRGRHHPTLDCEDTISGWAAELTRPAPAVAGRPGFWFDGRDLAWEYAPHAWATLVVYRRGAAVPHAAIVKVAAHVTYAATAKPSVKFPFRLTGLPPSWRVTSAPWRATADGLLATPNIGWEGGYPTVGPANGRYAGTIRQIAITPGKSKCPFFHGSSSSHRVVLDGVTAVVTRFTGSGVRPYQGLCVPVTHGLHVLFLELPEPGHAGFAFGGVTGIFQHHLHLLGPDPAHWTTHPLG